MCTQCDHGNPPNCPPEENQTLLYLKGTSLCAWPPSECGLLSLASFKKQKQNPHSYQALHREYVRISGVSSRRGTSVKISVAVFLKHTQFNNLAQQRDGLDSPILKSCSTVLPTSNEKCFHLDFMDSTAKLPKVISLINMHE